MATSRKDSKGRVLRKGETQRASDGKYMYVYRDVLGRRRYIYSNDLMKLREREKKVQRDVDDGIDTYTASKRDLNYLFDCYMATKVNLRRTTRTTYTYTYDRYVRETIGKKMIISIKYSDIMRFYKHLLVDRGLSITSVKRVHELLQPAFDLGVRDELIRHNPCKGTIKALIRDTGARPNKRFALTIEQQTAFINYMVGSPVFTRWTSLLVFLFGTGCRIGEVVGIRWEDIDFEKKRISINHTLSYRPCVDNEKKCIFMVDPPKSDAGNRMIPMTTDVYETMKHEYEVQQENGFNDLQVDGMSGFVFSNRFGNLYTLNAVNKAIQSIRTAYNEEEMFSAIKEKREPVLIPHFSCHVIRHTFATRLCEVESNLKVIQTIMGHSDIRTTMEIYAEATEAGMEEAMDRLSEKM